LSRHGACHEEQIMTNSDERPAARERAAFHISIEYITDSAGQVEWQTRADHEESGAQMVWPGAPGEQLLHWLVATAELPVEPGAQPSEQPAAPADDFTQILGIGAATAQRLYGADIRTYDQLAATPVAELSALLNMLPERIIKRGWIARARALSKLASLASRPPMPKAEAEPEPLPRRASAAAQIELHFDENGAIFEQRLLRETETPSAPIRREEGYIARFFVEPSTLLSEQLAHGTPGEVLIELDELELEELHGTAGSAAPQLCARSVLRLSGFGAAQLLHNRPSYLAFILAYELETGETKMLQSVAGQLEPETHEEPLDIIFAMPEVGRYQMALVTMLADYTALGAATGPRLRVNP